MVEHVKLHETIIDLVCLIEIEGCSVVTICIILSIYTVIINDIFGCLIK